MTGNKKIYVLTKTAGIEFGMYHDAGVFFVTESQEAADILITVGCVHEEWDLTSVDDAKKIKAVYDRMTEHEKYYKELDEKNRKWREEHGDE